MYILVTSEVGSKQGESGGGGRRAKEVDCSDLVLLTVGCVVPGAVSQICLLLTVLTWFCWLLAMSCLELLASLGYFFCVSKNV